MTPANRTVHLTRISAAFGAYAVAAGLLTLLGWALDVPRLTAWDNSVSQMPNSALGVVAAGAGLICWWRGWRRSATALGAFTALLALATLFEHLAGIDLGIDRLVLPRQWGQEGTVAPGRMGVPGSISLAVVGLSIVAKNGRRTERWATIGGLLTVAIAVLSLIGYLFSADPLYTIPKLTTIALQTSTILLALGAGLVFSVADGGPIRVLLGDSAASLLLRRTLPGIVLALIILGWLSLQAQQAGLLDTAFAIAALVLVLIGMQAAVLWRAAGALAVHEAAMRANRDRLAGILGSITDSLVTLDRDWRFVFINDEAAARLGRPRAELIGVSIWDVVPLVPDDARQHLQRAMAARIPVAYEVYYPPAGAWFATRAYPMADGGLAVLSRDITDRKEAERALRESEQKFALLFQKAAFGAALARLPDGVFIDVNEEFVEMFGYTREEVVGKTSLELGINPDAGARRRILEELQKRGFLRDLEMTLFTKSGEKRTFLNNITTVEIAGEKHLLTTLQDITERKAADDALRASAEALRAADRIKDEFLATLSHELRTPLTSIIGWSQILLDGALGGRDLRVGLEAIRSSAKAQAQLTDDVLDVSRITTGKMRLQRQWVDLAAVVDAAAATVRPAAEGKRVALRLALDRSLPPHFVDPERIQQVAWNLLSNAIKFSPEGAAVEVVLRGEPEGAALEVTDHGAGISREFLPHLFERFRQADSSATRAHAGLGIGLALSKDLVELHGGRIEAASEEGRGSRFTVRLPPPPAHDSVAPQAGAGGTSAHDESSLAGLRVLYVDDREDARTLIGKMLERHGADVLQASSVEEALAILSDARLDVIVTDLAMPLRDGYGLLTAIRSDRQWDHLPILALTAQGRIDDELRAATAGFQAFLRKPIESHDLAAAVARAAKGAADRS